MAGSSIWRPDKRSLEEALPKLWQYVSSRQFKSGQETTSITWYVMHTPIISPMIMITIYIPYLAGDLKHIWQDLNKVIDTLHIRNHKDKRCREKYNPQSLKEKCLSYNTMCCKQTFVWLSRFKKILCAMPKEHFHFYMHRMVKRRNRYIEYCYAHNRRPVLPKVR